ncbi:hypothetical protein ACTL6P_19795 [Endozoicomonas acroporae]|uniref:hypothetical protein n=1 Tax=Endozoicomonas acroporae TaxID=1701104 RepID=UPI000C75D360|nr:hypothetical protein [Endozoicomonas acroporae]
MAIYGVGSKWNEKELKDQFFDENKFILGWNEDRAEDLYSFISALKIGDILYIKSNAPGSRKIKVKGVGVVTKNLFSCISSGELGSESYKNWKSLFVKVAWISKDAFEIEIPEKIGKLTNIRAATIYEEYLPYVQEMIVDRLIKI